MIKQFSFESEDIERYLKLKSSLLSIKRINQNSRLLKLYNQTMIQKLYSLDEKKTVTNDPYKLFISDIFPLSYEICAKNIKTYFYTKGDMPVLESEWEVYQLVAFNIL